MSITRHHNDWLTLVPNSGPFLSLPVLAAVFPQGLDAHDVDHARRLRLAFDEWEEDQLGNRPDPAIHRAWIKFVLEQTLEYEGLLAEGQEIPQSLKSDVAEYGETLRPDCVVNDPSTKKARLLVKIYPRSQSLTKPVQSSRWHASPDTRMMQLLHDTGIRLGIVTNGDHWMLVNAPKNETTGYVSWYANLWREEAITLRAFRTLLGADRLFSVPDDETLEALLDRSASDQQEVTDQLGYQVRRAVEVLIQSLDKADHEHGGKLLQGIDEKILYESALTVMMRLVFLFCAEERELLLLGDDLYDKNYAVSTLREQLRSTADQFGEEILGLRYDAWTRLLTTFRAVYAGVKHDRMKLPAYGGSLFDPDRFPFLEGRKLDTTWRDTEAAPLPIDNRTVLHLLESLQTLETKLPGDKETTRRKISFSELGIEQIGHVYEGLLDHTAKRATEPVLGLQGTRDKEPEIALSQLEELAAKGEKELLKFLKAETGRSESALKKGLDAEIDDLLGSRFRTACQDSELWKRVQPFAGLVRQDTFGYPVVITQGSVFVTAGTDRRSSGTHYTPKSLTEPIVQYTLEPLVYVGPAEGKPKEEWKLRTARELLELKICDMACGSGAFLVQACRYMAARLLEAWKEAVRGVESGEKGEKNDGITELPRPRSLAESDDASRAVLSGDTDLSEGRTVRNDQSDSSLGSVDSSEHSGGSGTTAHEGVSELPEHRTGIAEGSRDTSDSEPTSGPHVSRTTRTTAQADRRNQPDDVGTEKDARKASLNSPHSQHSTPHLRVTPEGEVSTGQPGELLIPLDPDEQQTFALRIIAQRCLYGVDKNPLAAEMAKLSLWLLTLAKDKPFEFLDHAIRCGDSLVGIHNLDQLRKFNLDGKGEDNRLFLQFLNERINEAITLRRQITEMQANSVDDVEAQDRMLHEAEEKIERLKCVADLLIGAEFTPGSTADKRAARDDNAIKVAAHFHDSEMAGLRQEADKSLGDQQTFHWPLEFPEVIVEKGGFSAFVGNPPFMGGRLIGRSIGEEYHNFISYIRNYIKGSPDLCAYFLLRANSILQAKGAFGLLATKTISQTGTRAVSLDYLLETGGSLFRAYSMKKWPGVANVVVAVIHMWKGDWNGSYSLNDEDVVAIDGGLQAGVNLPDPYKLMELKGQFSQGQDLMGRGFELTPDERSRLIAEDPASEKIIQPLFNGQDINNMPVLVPRRWVINFRQMVEDEARQYPAAFRRLEELVKPYRDGLTGQIHETCFWKFWDYRKRLVEQLDTHDKILASPVVTKYVSFRFVPTSNVYNHKTKLYYLYEWWQFGVLQSSLHQEWAYWRCATLGGKTFSYSTSSALETWPMPNPTDKEQDTGRLDAISKQYHEHRDSVMQDRNEGLTEIYNRFHDPAETSEDIRRLRELHVCLDNLVKTCYGWDDFNLEHDFSESPQGVRFTISDPARREVLQRLLKLNHERYAEEVKEGLHGKKKSGGRRAGSGVKKKAASNPAKQEASLFHEEDDE